MSPTECFLFAALRIVLLHIFHVFACATELLYAHVIGNVYRGFIKTPDILLSQNHVEYIQYSTASRQLILQGSHETGVLSIFITFLSVPSVTRDFL